MRCLMYHRVSIPDTNPWGVCVSPKHFEEQIAWITARFRVITPAELSRQLDSHTVDEDSILISFDDGYQDNFTQAKPILEKYRCPAVFFIPTFYIGVHRSFWWDELEWIFLHAEKLPAELRLVIGSDLSIFRFGPGSLTRARFQQHVHWRWYQLPATERCSAFLAIWQRLRALPQPEIDRQMAFIRKWSGLKTGQSGFRLPMRKPQLEKLAAHPLFTVAAHTHTHPDLSSRQPFEQNQEIMESRNVLFDQYGINNNFFAYPYGLYSDTTLDLVNKLQFDLCFTTNQEKVGPGASRYELGRFQAQDWDLEDFKTMLG